MGLIIFPEINTINDFKCLKGEPLTLYSKGNQIRDWLYVEDHACITVSCHEGWEMR